MYAMVLIEQCFDVQVFVLVEIMYVFIYTEQNKKRNNYIPLNFEQTMIQS